MEFDKQKMNKFFSEILMLKRLRHEGFRLAGVEDPDSLAEHTALSAQIAFILAELEGADSAKCVLINTFHDNHEIRTGDNNKVNARYIDSRQAELTAEDEQLSNLPIGIKSKLLSLLNEKHQRSTKEGVIAQDADWLEIAIQAKYYTEIGHKGCEDWINNVEQAVETKSAKEILQIIKNDDDFINTWWQGLKIMTYTKLDDKK